MSVSSSSFRLILCTNWYGTFFSEKLNKRNSICVPPASSPATNSKINLSGHLLHLRPPTASLNLSSHQELPSSSSAATMTPDVLPCSIFHLSNVSSSTKTIFSRSNPLSIDPPLLQVELRIKPNVVVAAASGACTCIIIEKAPNAIKEIKKFAQKDMGTTYLRVDVKLNKQIWSRGILGAALYIYSGLHLLKRQEMQVLFKLNQHSFSA